MNRWFLHPQHGFMLRYPSNPGWEMVVTALCLDTREIEEDAARWEAHKSRLYVNAGCGAIAADEMRVGDHNPAFVPVDEGSVPEHIREDFLKY